MQPYNQARCDPDEGWIASIQAWESKEEKRIPRNLNNDKGKKRMKTSEWVSEREASVKTESEDKSLFRDLEF